MFLRVLLLVALMVALVSADRHDHERCPSWLLETRVGWGYDLGEFNLVAFGDVFGKWGDIEGRALIGGDATFLDYTIGNGIDGEDHYKPFSLIVGGNLCWNSGSLFPDGSNRPHPSAAEFLYLFGDFVADPSNNCAGTPQYLQDRLASGQFQNITSGMIDLQNKLRAISWSLLDCPADQLAVGTPSSGGDGGYFFTGPRSPRDHTYCTTVQISDWNAAQYRAFISLDPEASWIVNLVGDPSTAVQFQGALWPGIGHKTVINIPGGNDIKILGGERGNILAVDSNLWQPYGVAEGVVIVDNVKVFVQANRIYCECDCHDEHDHEHDHAPQGVTGQVNKASEAEAPNVAAAAAAAPAAVPLKNIKKL